MKNIEKDFKSKDILDYVDEDWIYTDNKVIVMLLARILMKLEDIYDNRGVTRN